MGIEVGRVCVLKNPAKKFPNIHWKKCDKSMSLMVDFLLAKNGLEVIERNKV